MSAVVGSSVPPNAKSLRPALRSQRSSRSDYAIAVVVVAALAVAAFALGRLGASSLPGSASPAPQVPEQAASSSAEAPTGAAKTEAEVEAPALAARPRALTLIPFVPVEVVPAHGEIWLDREVAGVGSVQLGAIDDGRLHELRFVAPGHETKTLFFRNTPPAGRVILKPIDDRQDAPALEAPLRTARSEAAAKQRHEPPRVESGARRGSAERQPSNPVARGPAPAARPAARTRASTDDAASDVGATSKKAPRVQLIEVHMPRVEVLD